LLRALSFLIPIVAAMLTGLAIIRFLPTPATGPGVVLWWTTLIGSTLLAMKAFDRLGRRLLPLAWLLRMTMAFPDEAPSRLRILLQSGTVGELRDRIVRARAAGDESLAETARTILSLAAAINNHDGTTRAHSERVQAYSDLLGAELGLADDDCDRLRWAALLHDVGKLAVPADILNKEGKPTEAEWAIIRTHPQAGMEIAGPLVPWLGPWAQTIEHHHEWFDGSGYPYGWAGEEIALGARIVAVADAYDTITSYRSYKKPLSAETARRELEKQAGLHFDPRVVRALFNVSLGKLRWVIGPASWLAQLPFVGGLERLGRDVAVLSATLLAFLMLFVGGVLAAPGVGAGDFAGSVSREPGDASAPSAADGGQSGTPIAPPGGGRPEAFSDAATTSEDEPVVIAVLANDADNGGGTLVVTVTEQPGSGSAVVDGPDVVYTPHSQSNGEDSFRYEVCNGSGGCSGAAVTVSVTAVNDPPVTFDDRVVLHEGRAVTFSPLENDADPDGEELVLGRAPTSAAGFVVVQTADTLTFTAGPGFGIGFVSYEACDPAGVCTVGRVTIEASPDLTPSPPPTAPMPVVANRPPVLADVMRSVDEDGTLTWVPGGTDPDGDRLTCVLETPPAHGVAWVMPDCLSATYAPAPDYGGPDSLRVLVGDGSEFVSATVTITVVSVEDRPVAVDDATTTPMGTGVHIDVAANDSDPENGALAVRSVADPVHGSALVNASGTVTYTPAAGFSGLDSFTYQVCDPRGACATGLVSVIVQ
jgi:hypothetical protein